MHPDLERLEELLAEYEASGDEVCISEAYQDGTVSWDRSNASCPIVQYDRLPEAVRARFEAIQELREKLRGVMQETGKEAPQTDSTEDILEILEILEGKKPPSEITPDLVRQLCLKRLSDLVFEQMARKTTNPSLKERFLKGKMSVLLLTVTGWDDIDEAISLAKKHPEIDFGNTWMECFSALIRECKWEKAYYILDYDTRFTPLLIKNVIPGLSEEAREELALRHCRHSDPIHPLQDSGYNDPDHPEDSSPEFSQDGRALLLSLLRGNKS